MTWFATHMLAWCGVCPASMGMRAEAPVTAADRARLRRWAQKHADATGHTVSLEEGRTDHVTPTSREEKHGA